MASSNSKTNDEQNLEYHEPVTSITRRGFMKASACAGGSWMLLAGQPSQAAGAQQEEGGTTAVNQQQEQNDQNFDFSSASWLWYPSTRCLQNTVALFRRQMKLADKPVRATGHILADSRYLLWVNGKRVQFGPAPCDPRWAEADPVDLTDLLQSGENVIGSQVLFYGQGEGTWVAGKPGFIFRLEIEYPNGQKELLVSDSSWRTHLARSWPPGHYKRWYLRTLQEEFDARLYPRGWTTSAFELNADWVEPMVLSCPTDKPAVCSSYPDYAHQMQGKPELCNIRTRSIPLMKETLVPVAKLAENYWINWHRPVEEYFECVQSGAYEAERKPAAEEIEPGRWRIVLPDNDRRGASLNFLLAEQVIGWPYFTITAPEGTRIEMLVHEAHEQGGPAMLNTHFHSWTRFTCREGKNCFETFDYESLLWMQLHIHGGVGEVIVENVGVRRRVFPWQNPPAIKTNEPELQKLIDASFNTLDNCAQETLVDGMARERQQYSGDVGHQLHAVHLGRGETRLPARFVRTYGQGLSVNGYFIDCWPAWDRLNRISSRHINMSHWGPILDHGIGFNFDCYYHWLYTARREDLEETWPRLREFAHYLKGLQQEDDLLPVEDLGVPCVWMDHLGFKQQKHKQCAFNLYASAMLLNSHAGLCRLFDDKEQLKFVKKFGQALHSAAVRKFWSKEHGMFVDNLPWLKEEKETRLHDRTLATSIMFDQCPDGQTSAAVETLVKCPENMGFSFPANACWRLWALGKVDKTQVIVNELRNRWANLESVRLNNTLSEDWDPQKDSAHEWSHCPVVPIYIIYQVIAGLRPTAAGFKNFDLVPQLADLQELDLTAWSPHGPIRFKAEGSKGQRRLTVHPPKGTSGQLVLHKEEKVDLKKAEGPAPKGFLRYQLPADEKTTLKLKKT
jgi:hypothetical protein